MPDDIRVLVIDDEAAIRRFLGTSLKANGYNVFEAVSGAEALSTVVACRPDILVLDLGLPDMDGIDVIRRLREWSQISVIVLSARGQESDKIAALNAGADDYLIKPFSVGELIARLGAVLRRMTQSQSGPIFQIGDLRIDLAARIVSVDNDVVQLTPTEYDLLREFVTHAGKVLTHQHLLRYVWGMGDQDELHLLRVNVSNLRRKIEPEPTRPRYIVTEPGVGYRFHAE